ncbi:MAG: metallophosphoesterase [Frankiaceae bacterium]
MRVNVVSDVHCRVDRLAAASAGADALLCLGDLLLFLDYDHHGEGIFADLFGSGAAARLIELRTAGRFDEARDWSGKHWSTVGDRQAVIDGAIHRQYAALFDAMPVPAYLTYGNVDVPHLLREHVHDGQRVLDGEVVELGGRTFGFVGGGLRTRYRTPYELDDDEYAAKVAAVGSVDVLCAHIPPDVPDLLFDTVARRLERGSQALLAAIHETRPKLVLFGHVHNPLAARMRIGRTECVNVGHFRATGTPYRLEW